MLGWREVCVRNLDDLRELCIFFSFCILDFGLGGRSGLGESAVSGIFGGISFSILLG